MSKSIITLQLTFESSKELYEYAKLLEEFKAWREGELHRKKTEIIYGIRIDDLELSMRSQNCLKNVDLICVRDLLAKTEAELLKAPNFGRKSLREIREHIYGEKNMWRWGHPFTEEDFDRWSDRYCEVRDQFDKLGT